MKGLLLNKSTDDALQRFLKRPTHALVLVGPSGAGKYTLARRIASSLLDIDYEQIGDYPYFMEIRVDDNESISIDAVREIIHFTTLKTTGRLSIARVIIIENGELLTPQAQNALLKTIEEPPADTVIIMTVSNIESILPTVRSRVQQISLQPVDRTTTKEHFTSKGYNDEAIERAYLMSGGLPGLMSALLDSDSDHPLWQATEIARDILRSSTYERLIIADSLYKQKQLSMNTLFMIGQMADAALRRPGSNDSVVRKWSKVLEACYDARAALVANTQARLVLLNFMLAL